MSELSVLETYHPYPGLKLPDGTWISSDIPGEIFVLKKTPNSTFRLPRGTDVYHQGPWAPVWFINLGYEIERPIRFKAVAKPFLGRIGAYSNDWLRVYCFDKIQHLTSYRNADIWNRGSFLSCALDWKVMFISEFGELNPRQGNHSKRGRMEVSLARNFLKDNVQVIRLRMYWVLRGIVGFKRLLVRSLRHKRRKIFIQATYWGHPKCTLSCFSGTINTQVKQRIHAFI